MKKVVQSRWNGCSLSTSQVNTLGQFSSRCRVALDRGAFSDLEVSTVLRESDELESIELHRQKTWNEDAMGDRSSDLPVVAKKRLHPSKSADQENRCVVSATRYPRRARARLSKLPSGSDVRPKEKYCELIVDVFRNGRKVQMKKAEIVANLKSRYPYFKNVRGFECRIGEVLTRNPAFKLTGPGMWAYIGNDGGGGEGSRPRKRLRVRRRPDFLRLDWKKSGRAPQPGPKGHLSRRESDRMDTSTESEDDIVKPATSFSSSTSLGDQRIASTMKDSKISSSNSEIDLYKKVLMDFNKEILKRVVEEITEANKKCFENLMTTIKASEHSTTTDSEEPQLPETVRKKNQQLLQKTIDKLIADNEKCLMDLSQSTAEYRNGGLPTSQLPQPESNETMKSISMPEKRFVNTPDTHSLNTNNCNLQQSEPTRSESDKWPRTHKKVVGRTPYPLPTILKHSIKANNHMKFGKRVIPRLSADSSADSAINPSQSDSSEQDDYSHKFKQVVPGPKQRLVDLGLHSMTTISPSTTSTKIRLSVDPSEYASPTKSPVKVNENVDKSCRTNDAADDKSVSDVFAEYARRNSELKDIVAMIDPTLSSALNPQDCQASVSNQSRANSELRPPPASLPCASSNDNRHGRTVGKNTNNAKIDVRPTNSNKKVPTAIRYTQGSTRSAGSRPIRNLAAIIDVKPNVSGISTTKHPRPVHASAGIQTSNSNQQTRVISATHPGPSKRPIRPRSQPSTSQSRVLSNGGIDIRYVPPYRWGFRPTGVTQQNRLVNSTSAPRGVHSYHVVYPSARPVVYNRAVRSPVTFNSAVACRRGNALNDVRCRIRGATVLRFPVRK